MSRCVVDFCLPRDARGGRVAALASGDLLPEEEWALLVRGRHTVGWFIPRCLLRE